MQSGNVRHNSLQVEELGIRLASQANDTGRAVPVAEQLARFQQLVLVVVGIEVVGNTPLAQVGFALGHPGLLFGLRHRRQEQRSQNSDDRDDHQQLNQGEPRSGGLVLIQGVHAFISSRRLHTGYVFVSQTGSKRQPKNGDKRGVPGPIQESVAANLRRLCSIVFLQSEHPTSAATNCAFS